MKLCYKCKENKPLDSFGILRKSEDGLYPKCKECVKIDTANNKIYRINYNKRYRLKNKDKARERNRLWIAKSRANNPKRYKDYEAEWRKNNPDKVFIKNVYNRSCRKQATPVWLTNEQLFQMEMFYRLAKSRRMFEDEVFHVDHIIPLKGATVCGLHVPWNLRVIPGEQNRKKSNKITQVGN